jgi:hypothetical protein
MIMMTIFVISLKHISTRRQIVFKNQMLLKRTGRQERTTKPLKQKSTLNAFTENLLLVRYFIYIFSVTFHRNIIM